MVGDMQRQHAGYRRPAYSFSFRGRYGASASFWKGHNLFSGFLLFFGVEYIVSQMVFSGVFGGCLAFIMVIVQLLDYPFEGALRLLPSGFQETIVLFVILLPFVACLRPVECRFD